MSFLSTLSLRRATGRFGRFAVDPPYFYPRSPCGERPTDMRQRLIEFRFLSTLSLRRATHLFASSGVDFAISIHALLAESDSQCRTLASGIYDFYPRSPCGERQDTRVQDHGGCLISIHALLAESDDTSMPPTFIFAAFLSTLSLRRATGVLVV